MSIETQTVTLGTLIEQKYTNFKIFLKEEMKLDDKKLDYLPSDAITFVFMFSKYCGQYLPDFQKKILPQQLHRYLPVNIELQLSTTSDTTIGKFFRYLEYFCKVQFPD